MTTAATAVERVLAVARSQLHVREQGGANRGPEVDRYLARVHWDKPAPWCAAFVGWCGSEALGRAWPLPLVPGTWSLLDFAKKHGFVVPEPAPGRLFLVYSTARASWHVGFITAPGEGGRWHTLEGNTAPGGSHNGDGVYSLERQFPPSTRFIDWTRGLPDVLPSTET